MIKTAIIANILAWSFVANATKCESFNVLVTGQSNAAALSNKVNLSRVFGNTDCPAKIFTAALGGLPASEFIPSSKAGTMYQSAITKIGKDKIDLIVISQGEQDLSSTQLSHSWLSKWADTIGSYRAQVGRNIDIPVVVIQLHDRTQLPVKGYPEWEHLRSYQPWLAKALPNVKIVDPTNYEWLNHPTAGHLHMTKKGYQDLAVDIAKLAAPDRI